MVAHRYDKVYGQMEQGKLTRLKTFFETFFFFGGVSTQLALLVGSYSGHRRIYQWRNTAGEGESSETLRGHSREYLVA